MKTSFAFLIPASLIFAWSAPWACQSYTLPDGGTSTTNPYLDGGNGGRFQTDAGAIAVYVPDAGMIGIAAADGGGVTVGASADFVTDFAYASNYSDGTVSRVLIQDDAGLPPFEQARYVGIIPQNNHGSNTWANWKGTSYCGDQLAIRGYQQQGVGGYYGNSPSRTVVDRKGNVWVALRAMGTSNNTPNGSCQAGVTRIINVGDHLSDCHIRCPNRTGLAPNQYFTEGIPLTKATGGTVTLLPSAPPAAIAATITGSTMVLPEAVIAAGTTAATTFSCPGHNPADDTDPVNYDDCIAFSIALGSPNPDMQADPGGAIAGYANPQGSLSFARAAAISPNCNPASAECDVWIGMWNNAAWLRLSNGSSPVGGPPTTLGDVVGRVNLDGYSPYGGSVDCAGIVWGQSFSTITATTTVPVVLPGGLPDGGDATLAPYSLIAEVPNYSGCSGYGIASDTSERIWTAGWTGGSNVCSFNGAQLVADYPLILDAGATNPIVVNAVMQGWQTYNLGMGGNGRGVNVDLNNNIYQGMDSQYAACGSMNPDPPATGTFTPIACSRSGGGTCVDKLGNPAPNGVLNWTHAEPNNQYGNNTIGVDLDDEGNVWLGQEGGSNSGPATAVRLNGQTGAFLSSVPVGSGLYSYSDFTGYALRHITLSSSNYFQTFTGCGVSPELTSWSGIGFTAALPSGTDISFSVTVTNADDATTLQNAQPYPVCASVTAGCGQGVPATGGTITLPNSLPQGSYLTVYATLVPKICSLGGGGLATGKPILYALTTTQVCAGD